MAQGAPLVPVGEAVGDVSPETVPQSAATPPSAVSNQGKSVAIVDPDGTISTVAAGDLTQAMREGARVATGAEVQQAELEAKYGGVAGTLGAAGAGAARGLTLGLSDPAALAAAEAFGGEKARTSLRETLAGLKEAHPYVSTGAEITGALAPILFSGGAGAAAEGGALARGLNTVGILPRGVAAAGRLAEEGAASLVGSGATSLLGRAAQAVLPTAAAGAAEGALYSLGSAVSESALGDTDLTAERMFAALGHGALLGGAIGGGAKFGSFLVAEAGRKVASEAAPLLTKALGADSLGELSDRSMFAALRPTLRDVKTVERFNGGIAAVGRDVKEALKEELGKTIGRASLDDIEGALTRKVDKLGEKLSTINKNLDETAEKIGAKPDIKPIMARLQNEIVTPLYSDPATQAAANRVHGYMSKLWDVTAEGEGLTFSKLHSLRKTLGDEVFKESRKLVQEPGLDAMRDVVRILEDEYTIAGEKVANELGGKFATDYKDTKRIFSNILKARDIAAGRLERDSANMNFGLGDRLVATMGAAAGASHGLLSGGIIGTAGALASKAFRERGNQMLADVLDRAALMQKIRQASQKTEVAMQRGVKAFLAEAPTEKTVAKEAAKAASKELAMGTPKEMLNAFYKHADELTRNTATPQMLTERMARVAEPLQRVAPNVAGAMGMVATRGAEYLRASLPATVDAQRAFPLAARRRPTDAEVTQFMRKVAVVRDPTTVVRDLQKGTLSHDAVDALRSVYPREYAALTQLVQTEITNAKPGTSPSLAKLRQLSLLLGQPLDPSMTADYMAWSQGAFAGISATPPPGSGSSKPPMRPMKVDYSRQLSRTATMSASQH